jgi:hypothetical protein
MIDDSAISKRVDMALHNGSTNTERLAFRPKPIKFEESSVHVIT